MDTKSLDCFIRLYKDKNISVAANNLYMTQQGLSRIIKRMEQEVGASLFERSNKGVTPTSTGRLLYQQANAMLASYRVVLDSVNRRRDGPSGEINAVLELGCLPILTPNAFLRFIAEYPLIKLSFGEHREVYCHNWLLEGKADIAFVVKPVEAELYDIYPLCGMECIVYLNKDHRLAQKEHITTDDLYGEKLLLCGSANYYTILRDCKAAGFEPRIAMCCTDVNVTIQCVQSGLGVCPFMLGMNKAFPCPDDIVIRPYVRSKLATIYMITKKGVEIPSHVRILMDYLMKYYSSHR